MTQVTFNFRATQNAETTTNIMANETKTERAEETTNLVVHEIKQISVDRTPKDVQSLRVAQRIAENIHTPNRTRMLDLFADVDMDGYLTGVWQKRLSAATNKTITFTNAKGEKEDALDTLMRTDDWEQLLGHILESVRWGLSGFEFIMGKKFAWQEIPRKHILIEKGIIKENQNDQSGWAYADNPMLWVVGKKNDYGLMLKCSFYALIKKGNFADWAQYSEIFGQPIRVIYYDAFDDKTRVQLKQVLDDAGSSLALMIPNQAKFEIMDGKSSNGDGQLQERLKNACNNEMGIIILGNTETTGNDNGGSNAKAQEQGKQQLEITKKDIKFLLSQLNDERFINILASYGYPVQGGKFEIQEEADPYKVKAQMEVVTMVRASGTPVDDEHVYKITGIPKPDNYDAIKAATEKEAVEAKELNKEREAKPSKSKDLADNIEAGIWHRIRTKLADFFDPPQS